LALNSEVIYGALKALNHQYCQRNSGLRVQEHNGRFQLVTYPYLATLIETYLSLDLTTKLTAPALETLAIIAYRQPVTRAQIEAVRGVDSSGVLRSLLQRGLVEEAGRLEGVGRPILYTVTEEFMHHFGLTGLDELPQLETTDADTLWVATKLAEFEEAGAANVKTI
jgi:segregation and condensation protein B